MYILLVIDKDRRQMDLFIPQ